MGGAVRAPASETKRSVGCGADSAALCGSVMVFPMVFGSGFPYAAKQGPHFIAAARRASSPFLTGHSPSDPFQFIFLPPPKFGRMRDDSGPLIILLVLPALPNYTVSLLRWIAASVMWVHP